MSCARRRMYGSGLVVSARGHIITDRKLAEIVVSMELERSYKKDELLESYLNTVYFGHGVYGVERAAQKYFGKGAGKLDAAEAAALRAHLESCPECRVLFDNDAERGRALAAQVAPALAFPDDLLDRLEANV